MNKHIGTIYSRCTTETPTEGPLTVDQQRALEAWTDMRQYNAQRFSPGTDPVQVIREAERGFRCMTWVVDATDWDGNELGHACPGYYDCLRCYRD